MYPVPFEQLSLTQLANAASESDNNLALFLIAQTEERDEDILRDLLDRAEARDEESLKELYAEGGVDSAVGFLLEREEARANEAQWAHDCDHLEEAKSHCASQVEELFDDYVRQKNLTLAELRDAVLARVNSVDIDSAKP